MSDHVKIVNQYKNILKCFFIFIFSVILYMAVIVTQSEEVFVNSVSFYMFFGHYLILLFLILTFAIVITARLYRLSKLLYEVNLISLKPTFVMLGYILSFAAPLLLKPRIAICILPATFLSYLMAFWVLGNKYLKILPK